MICTDTLGLQWRLELCPRSHTFALKLASVSVYLRSTHQVWQKMQYTARTWTTHSNRSWAESSSSVITIFEKGRGLQYLSILRGRTDVQVKVRAKYCYRLNLAHADRKFQPNKKSSMYLYMWRDLEVKCCGCRFQYVHCSSVRFETNTTVFKFMHYTHKHYSIRYVQYTACELTDISVLFGTQDYLSGICIAVFSPLPCAHGGLAMGQTRQSAVLDCLDL